MNKYKIMKNSNKNIKHNNEKRTNIFKQGVSRHTKLQLTRGLELF